MTKYIELNQHLVVYPESGIKRNMLIRILADLHSIYRKDSVSAEKYLMLLPDYLPPDERKKQRVEANRNQVLWKEYLQAAKITGANLSRPPARLPARAFFKNGSIYYQADSQAVPRLIFTDSLFQSRPSHYPVLHGLIAAKGTYRDNAYSFFREHGFTRNVCLVVDTLGKLLQKIDDTHSAALSPYSDLIVYTRYASDRYPEGHIAAEDIRIRNLNTGEDKSIAHCFKERVGQDLGWSDNIKRLSFGEVRWALFDARIYLTLWFTFSGGWSTYDVFGYDPQTNSAFPTPYKGLEFSPDGRFIFQTSQEGDPAHLFERSTNREIILEDFGDPVIEQTYQFMEWLSIAGRPYIYAIDGHIKYWLIDCETGAIQQLPPRISAVSISGKPDSFPAAAVCELHCLYYSPGGSPRLKKIYTNAGVVIDQVAVSPAAEFIALLASKISREQPGPDNSSSNGKSLLVLDAAGKEVARLNGVLAFAWSPEGDQIALIPEARRESRSIGTGIVLLNCASGDTSRLAAGSDSLNYRQVSWPAFGSAILAIAGVQSKRRQAMVRFEINPGSGEILKKESSADYRYLFANNFSSSSEFYFYDGNYSGGYELGRRISGEIIKPDFPDDAEIPNLYFLGWQQNGPETMLYAQSVHAAASTVWEINCETAEVQQLDSPAGIAWPAGVSSGKVYWAQKTGPDQYELLPVSIAGQ